MNEITTVEQLEALPPRAVIMDRWGIAFQQDEDGTWSGEGRDWYAGQLELPATVLHPTPQPSTDEREVIEGAVFDVLADSFSDAVTEKIARHLHERLSAAGFRLTPAPSDEGVEPEDLHWMEASDTVGGSLSPFVADEEAVERVKKVEQAIDDAYAVVTGGMHIDPQMLTAFARAAIAVMKEDERRHQRKVI